MTDFRFPFPECGYKCHERKSTLLLQHFTLPQNAIFFNFFLKETSLDMFAIFNQVMQKYCKNKTQFILNYHIYLYLYIHNQAYGLGPFFKLSLGKQKSASEYAIICEYVTNHQLKRKHTKQTKDVSFINCQQEVRGSRRESTMLHDTICGEMWINKHKHQYGLLLLCNELSEQRLQWEWHQFKSQWKQHSPTVQRRMWSSTHNAGYRRILAVNRLAPGIK